MRKVFALSLVLCILPLCAHALTVNEFMERYNPQIGKGFYNAYADEDLISGNHWFITGQDSRHMVVLEIDPESAERPTDCAVVNIFVRHKPRVSVSTFINNMSAVLAAVWPDVPEEVRLTELVNCLRVRDKVLGYSQSDDTAVPYHSEYFGEMVYQETSEYDTLLINVPGAEGRNTLPE